MIDKKFQKKLEKAVVRIKVENIEIDWDLPYQFGKISSGHGSGFFIDKQHIITCAHVIDSSKNVYIEIPSLGSQKIDVEIVSFCPKFDIALLKTIDYKSKYYLELGSAKNCRIGDEIYTVGYPVSMINENGSSSYNLKYTGGIISGTQLSLIQVTANINPGVSGSCLLHKDKVIGINSQKLVAEDIEGVGYSVPIDFFKVIQKNMLKPGLSKIIRRPVLAVSFSNTNKNLLDYVSDSDIIPNGVYISKLYENSPLKKIGIKEGDILTKIDGYNIDNFGIIDFNWLQTKLDIYTFLNFYPNNSKVSVEYYHNEKKYKKTLVLNEYEPPVRFYYPLFENVPFVVFAGMNFMNLSLNIVQRNPELIIKYTEDSHIYSKKVIISFIFPNTPTFILNNFSKNDVIVKVNDKKVETVGDVIKHIKKPLIHNKRRYVKFENENGKIVIVSLDKAIQNDIELAKIYNFPLSNIHSFKPLLIKKSKLSKKMNIKKK